MSRILCDFLPEGLKASFDFEQMSLHKKEGLFSVPASNGLQYGFVVFDDPGAGSNIRSQPAQEISQNGHHGFRHDDEYMISGHSGQQTVELDVFFGGNPVAGNLGLGLLHVVLEGVEFILRHMIVRVKEDGPFEGLPGGSEFGHGHLFHAEGVQIEIADPVQDGIHDQRPAARAPLNRDEAGDFKEPESLPDRLSAYVELLCKGGLRGELVSGLEFAVEDERLDPVGNLFKNPPVPNRLKKIGWFFHGTYPFASPWEVGKVTAMKRKKHAPY